MAEPLAWVEATRDLPERGRRAQRTASAAERAALVEALDLLACDRLELEYEIVPRAGGRYTLDGRLSADVTQACVVSLEPVRQSIEEAVSAEYWPSGEIDRPRSEGERAVLGPADPEPLGAHGQIEVGRLAFETLSAALDPYPRKSGAEFAWQENEESGAAAADNPFGVLKQLKDRDRER